MSVLRVEATTSYDVDGRPQYEAIPEGGVLTGVTRTASVRVHFDRFLDPVRVIRQSLCIRPILDDVFGIDDCVEPLQEFTEPNYSPARRMVTFRLPSGARLDAQTRYRVTIFEPASPTDSGFFAFDGAPLARRYVYDFETQEPTEDEVDEHLPSAERYCEVVRCFESCGDDAACKDACRPGCVEPTCRGEGDILSQSAGRASLFNQCASAGCHSSVDPFFTADPAGLAMGLDLFTTSGVENTAIGVTAHHTQHGETGASPTASGLVGRSMPRIDRNHPGNSFLLYKLLINPLNHPRPDGLVDAQLFAEIERLRAAFVTGLPMPAGEGVPEGIVPLESDPTGELSFAELVMIETWIAHGAVTSCP